MDEPAAVPGSGRLIVLGSADLKAENSLEQPVRVAPAETTLAPSGAGFGLSVDAQSFTVLRATYAR